LKPGCTGDEWKMGQTLKPDSCERRRGTPLKPTQDFENQFREAFGREMTVDERRYFRLSTIKPNKDKSNGDLDPEDGWNQFR
jgi:hypothetical protein